VFLLLGLAIGVAGCRRKKTTPAVVGTEETTAATDDTDEQLGQKLQGYIKDCLNAFSTRVHDSEGRYMDWVRDMKKGPTGAEKNVFGLYEVAGDPQKCATAITKSNAMKPTSSGLEKAGSDFGAALATIVPLVNDAFRYYDRGDYKEDKLARGKAMHANLSAGFAAFNKADDALAAEIEKVQEGLDQRQLAAIERKDGQRLPWHTKNTLIAAKATVHEGDDRVDRIDAAKFNNLVDNYTKAVDDLDAYARAHKAETDRAFWMDSYLSESQKYVRAARELQRRIKDKRPYTEAEKQLMGRNTSWMVDGSPGQLVSRYNDVVKAYNNVHFR
jgi:hypothetical protein